MPPRTSAVSKPPRLPPKVHPKGPSLYYVHRNKWHKLCSIDAPELTIYRELARLKSSLETTSTGELNELFDAFLKEGMVELELSKDTQDQYRWAINKHLRGIFGHMRISAVTAEHVAQMLRKFKKQGKPVTGNRVKAALGSIYSWGMSAGMAKSNPTLGVKRNREKPRSRYVTDAEFLEAFERASEPFQDLMAVALLTGLRQKDLRLLERSALTEDGIRLETSKDGKHVLVKWSDPLSYFVRRAVERCESKYVLTNTQCQPWTKNAINSVMRRLKTGWTFHDIRAKAESDHDTGLGLMARYKRARRLEPVH